MSSTKRNTHLVWMLSAYEKICSSRGYTKLGVEAVCAKVLSDFPEIITPETKVRKGGASLPEGGKLSRS